jgi:hypothetical protein
VQDNSSIFAIHFPSVLFPIYPAELVDFTVAHEAAIVARASAVLYANFSCDGGGPSGYPEPPFETCVDAGWGALTVFSVSVPVHGHVCHARSDLRLAWNQALARTLPASAHDAKSRSADHSHSRTWSQPAARNLADQFERYIAAYGANSSNLLA